MLAFLNDPKVKKKYLARVRAHQKADEVVKGKYWDDGRGCAVGCTIHGSNHKAYEQELGIPEVLAFLEDGIFENLPIADAKKWPSRFLEAIKPGVDLRRVHNRFLAWLLSEDAGILKFTDENRAAIATVRDLHARAGNGEAVSSAARSAWLAARSAAWSAAQSAACAAVRSAAESAAQSAAWTVRAAAESAAWSAEFAAESAAWSAEFAAESAARSAAYKKMAAKLLELLEAA